MKFFISKNKKLPRAAQKGLLPREEFMTKGKERFLAAFDASELARNARGTGAHARPAYVTAFFKIGVGVMAVLAVGVGLSAYADTANVAATSPLYPLKRISENVRLALAPAAEKPQLQATFAVRRANEIAALQASAPSSTLIPQLTNDMDRDIVASLGAAVNASATVAVGPAGTSSAPGAGYGGAGKERTARGHTFGGGAGAIATTTASSTIAAAATSSTVSTATIDVYCSAFDVSTSGVLIGHLEGDLSLRPDALARFNRQCGSDSDGGNGSSSSQDWRTRHPAGESVPATTTIVATGTISVPEGSTTVDVHAHIPPIGL